MLRTNFVNDFMSYYHRAKILQDRNTGLLPPSTLCNDPLQDNVTIYNCVNRRYAGFSNVLEDLTYGDESPAQRRYKKYVFPLREWLYLYLFHRMTGSGASFGPKDHGYRNSIADKVAEQGTLEKMVDYIKAFEGVMFTSLGNQIPPFPKPSGSGYKTGGKLYLCEYAPRLVDDVLEWFQNWQLRGIKEAVDFCLNWHVKNGLKRYHFVLTAFVMDIAEYQPQLVDPDSHCYYGSNCIRGFDLMYVNDEKIKKQFWYEQCMQDLVDLTGNQPYSLEDVVCDAVRYWGNYVPKGYEHLQPHQITRLSKLKIQGNKNGLFRTFN